MKNFKALRIWQHGVAIALQSYELTSAFPKEEKFGLTSQMTRAATSIASNIAEGSSRASEKEYLRFLEIALGSAFELETQLVIAKALCLGDPEKRQKLSQLIEQEQKMLSNMMVKLKK